MKIVGQKVLYDSAEIERFLPLWRIISADSRLLAKQVELSRKLFWANDGLLAVGKDPISKEAEQFAKDARNRASQLDPSLSERQLGEFIFYVLHHHEDSTEYNLDPPSQAQERH